MTTPSTTKSGLLTAAGRVDRRRAAEHDVRRRAGLAARRRDADAGDLARERRHRIERRDGQLFRGDAADGERHLGPLGAFDRHPVTTTSFSRLTSCFSCEVCVCVPAVRRIGMTPGWKPIARTRRFTAWPCTRAAGIVIVYTPCAFVATETDRSLM